MKAGLASSPLGRAALAVGVAAQPALWAAGRWGLDREAGGWLLELDRRGLEWMGAHRSAALDALLGTVTHLGSFALTAPLALALAALLASRGRRGPAWFAVGAFAGAALFAQLGKVLVGRARPDTAGAVVVMPSDLSFPSAHATQAMALALVAWLVLKGSRRGRRRAIATAAAAWVGLVALSRVYLQVHYPSDVAAGLAGAAAWVGGLWLATGAGTQRHATD